MNEQELREQIAQKIEAIYKCDCRYDESHVYYCPVPSIQEAAAIARGQK